MTDKTFLDTNVIVYAFDKAEPGKNTIARGLLESLFAHPECRISTQVVQEFCNVAFRKMEPPLTVGEVKEFVHALPEQQIEKVDLKTIDKALSIKEKYNFSFWDSLIVAAALLAGSEILYTEDMRDGLQIDTLRIVNPFT